MKKVLCVLLLVSMIFGMTSCRKVEEGEVRNASTVEEFAEAAGVSTEFAQSLNDAVGQVQEKYNRSFDISDVYNFRETDPWAGGKRYTIWLAEEYVLTVYEENDRVASIRTSNGEFAYQADEAKADNTDGGETSNGSIRLVDGVLGDYGKEVTIPSKTYGEYTYVWYQVPSGAYTVTYEGTGQAATIFVVGDNSSEDVRDTLQFRESGERQSVIVEDGTHLELSAGAVFVLMPESGEVDEQKAEYEADIAALHEGVIKEIWEDDRLTDEQKAELEAEFDAIREEAWEEIQAEKAT